MDNPKEDPKFEGFISGDNFETDRDAFFEDYIIADRAGLEVLREKITAVLESGEPSTFSDSKIDCDFGGITLGEKKPVAAAERDWVETVGCVFAIGVLIFLLFALMLGFGQIWEFIIG